MTQGPSACWGCFPATRIDVPALATMASEIFPSAWTETSLHIEVQREEGRIWLARSEVTENAPLAVMSVRATLRAGLADALAQATERELSEQQWLRATEDAYEGIRAVSERRPGRFNGK